MDVEQLRPIERRVLGYLDQRGATHRSQMAADLAKDGSRTAVHQNGSNGAVPLIVGGWCKRLVDHGLVRDIRDRDGFYRHHEITTAGRATLRSLLASRGRA